MFSWLTNLIAGVNMIIVLALLGAALGVVCYAAGKLSATFGLAVSAALGAGLMLWVYWGGVLDTFAGESAKQQIANLQAKAEKLQHDLQAAQEIRDFESKQADEATKKAEALAKQYQEVLALVDKHKDDADCISSEELEAIGKIQ